MTDRERLRLAISARRIGQRARIKELPRFAFAVAAFTSISIACGRANDDSTDAPLGGAPSLGGSLQSVGGRVATGGDNTVGGLPPISGDDGLPANGGAPAHVPSTWVDLQEIARKEPTPSDAAARPRGADFAPMLEPLGEPGWRESTAPFCHSLRFPKRVSLFADDDGVAVMTLGECTGALDSPEFECANLPIEARDVGTDIRYNDGTGWRWIYGHPLELSGLSGLPGRRTLVLTAHEAGIAKLSLNGELSRWFDGTEGQAFFKPLGLASGRVLFELNENNSLQSLQVMNAEPPVTLESWPGFPDNFLFTAADDDVYVLRDHDFYYLKSDEVDGTAELLADAPIGEWRALGFDPGGSFWAATTNAVFHFDGEEWSHLGDLPDDGGVVGAATAGGSFILVTKTQFLKATADSIEVLSEASDVTFAGVAASPQGEVFVAARDLATADDQCSGDFIARWDGTEFHLF